MTAQTIAQRLEQTLLHDGDMLYELYVYELQEHLDDLKASLDADNDDYIFTVTTHRGHVAMVLMEKSGQVFINAQARAKLRTLWPDAYASTMQQLIPAFAQQLAAGELPINGVKTTGES